MRSPIHARPNGRQRSRSRLEAFLIAPVFSLVLLASAAPQAARGAALCPVLVGSDLQDIAIGDFDRDGLADAAAADAAGKVGLVFGMPGLPPARFGGAVLTGAAISRVVAGDVNGDGITDLIAMSSAAGYLRVLTGHGDGTFSLGDPIETLPAANHVRGADFDGDGLLDLAILSSVSGAGTLAVQLADGAGGYGAPTGLWSGAVSIDDIAVGDLDGDGAADLVSVVNEVVSGARVVTIRVFHGHGDGSFDALPGVAGPAGLSALAIGDMDEDGRGDLVGVSGLTLPEVASIWLGQPDGSLGAEADFPKTFASGGGRAALADLNGDGHLDLAFLGGPGFPFILGCSSNVLTTMRGHGDGTLSDPSPLVATAGASLGLGVGDLNGDGIPDAVVAGGQCGDVAVHPGAGDGTFTTLTNAVRAFTDRHNDAIHVNNNKPGWCVYIEPVDGSFDLVTEAPTATLTLISEGTGSVSSITAGVQKEIAIGDADGNQVSDMRICFPKDRLRQLFSNVNGKQTLTLRIEGTIHDNSCKIGTSLTIDVFAGGNGNTAAAFVRPNPLNPTAVLTFRTDARGPYRVRIFDVSGRLVRTLRGDGDAAAGYHDVRIDGHDEAGRALASGVYLYRIESGGTRTEGRFVVAK